MANVDRAEDEQNNACAYECKVDRTICQNLRLASDGNLGDGWIGIAGITLCRLFLKNIFPAFAELASRVAGDARANHQHCQPNVARISNRS